MLLELHHQRLSPLGPGKCLFGRFVLRLSRIKRLQVMSMGKIGPTALNFVYDFVLSVHFFGTPYTNYYLFKDLSLTFFMIRNVLGTKNLGDILSERESIALEMQVVHRPITMYYFLLVTIGMFFHNVCKTLLSVILVSTGRGH